MLHARLHDNGKAGKGQAFPVDDTTSSIVKYDFLNGTSSPVSLVKNVVELGAASQTMSVENA